MRRGAGLVTWGLVYTKQAQKDAKRLTPSGLKPNVQELLVLIVEDHHDWPLPFEKPTGYPAGRSLTPHHYPAPLGSFVKKSVRESEITLVIDDDVAQHR